MSEPSKAIFLSYAREDADAARRIAEALRAFGIEVWFDQNELRGGDAWDASIRKQIRECALFVPVISATTQARTEGYFRREWRLAVERMQDMAGGVPFIVPVVIDNTPEKGALVPDEFMRVHWTRFAKGIPSPQFVDQVGKLLADRAAKSVPGSTAAFASVAPAPKSSPGVPVWAWALVVAVIVAGAVSFFLRPDGKAVPAAADVKTVQTAQPAPAAVPAPPPTEKSIAVLPFANLSAEKDNEFFVEGVQDDIITNLAKIRDLKVISRTSTLAYRDPSARNLRQIAADLGVAVVLEGSVRRVGTKVHMNAQLIDARTDAHLWADTFGGDTADIFALQADLAQKIAAALKVTLSGSERTLIVRRPTENPEAYELYSRARILHEKIGPFSPRSQYEPVVTLLEQAVTKDPGFALALAFLSGVHGQMFWFGHVDPTAARRERAKATLDAARRLAPDSPEVHLAQGNFLYTCENDWRGALAEYALAEVQLPNDAYLQYRTAAAHRRLADWPKALAYFERAAALNPHDLGATGSLVDSARSLHRYEQTRVLATRFLTIFPGDWRLQGILLAAQFALDGDRAAYARAWMAPKPNTDDRAQLQFKYEGELILGDLAAAEQTLADPRLTMLTTASGTLVEPVALHRAILAVARGQRENAAKFAAEAIAHYRNNAWTPRQVPHVLLDTALAEACAGEADAAIRDAREAMSRLRAMDSYSADGAEERYGRVHLILGRRDEALASMRRALGAPGLMSPNDFRIDFLWSQLRDDPRFEEILKSAKPL